MAAQSHASQLLVGEVLDHLQQARVGTEEILAEVSAALDKVFLILAIADFAHAANEQPVAVVLNERVPVAAPDDFDHIPSRAAEDRFQFLDDLAVAAHRTVETLQVAVDDEDQVVEPLASGQRDRTERLGLVHFAVAQEGPDFSARILLQAAVLEVLDEARVVDRLDRAEAHGDGGKFPEVLHQPGMRIGGQPTAGLQFAPEVLQFFLRDAAFEKRARVNAGRRVSLEVDDIAIALLGLGVQEMIESDFVERGGGGERRDVAADAFLNLVGADHHGQRVPAHQALDTPFHFLASREGGLGLRGNRVLVGRGRRKRKIQARRPVGRAEPIAAGGGLPGPARLWTTRSRENRATLEFPGLLNHRFASETRMNSPTQNAEPLMIFNSRDFCWH